MVGLSSNLVKTPIMLKLSDGREIVHTVIVAELEPPMKLGLDFLRQHDCELEASHSTHVIYGSCYALKRDSQLPSLCQVVV